MKQLPGACGPSCALPGASCMAGLGGACWYCSREQGEGGLVRPQAVSSAQPPAQPLEWAFPWSLREKPVHAPVPDDLHPGCYL